IKANVKSIHNKSDVIMTNTKTLFILVSARHLKEKYPNLDETYIINNIHTNKLRELIYKEYYNIKTEINIKEREKNNNQHLECFHKPVDYQQMTIGLTMDYISYRPNEDYDNEIYVRKDGYELPYKNTKNEEED